MSSFSDSLSSHLDRVCSTDADVLLQQVRLHEARHRFARWQLGSEVRRRQVQALLNEAHQRLQRFDVPATLPWDPSVCRLRPARGAFSPRP